MQARLQQRPATGEMCCCVADTAKGRERHHRVTLLPPKSHPMPWPPDAAFHAHCPTQALVTMLPSVWRACAPSPCGCVPQGAAGREAAARSAPRARADGWRAGRCAHASALCCCARLQLPQPPPLAAPIAHPSDPSLPTFSFRISRRPFHASITERRRRRQGADARDDLGRAGRRQGHAVRAHRGEGAPAFAKKKGAASSSSNRPAAAAAVDVDACARVQARVKTDCVCCWATAARR